LKPRIDGHGKGNRRRSKVGVAAAGLGGGEVAGKIKPKKKNRKMVFVLWGWILRNSARERAFPFGFLFAMHFMLWPMLLLAFIRTVCIYVASSAFR